MGQMAIRHMSRRGRAGYSDKARECYLLHRSRARYYKRRGMLRMAFANFRYLAELENSRRVLVVWQGRNEA